MFLTVSRAVGDAQTVLTVEGELDISTVKVLRTEIEQVLPTASGRMLIDLSGTTFIDSTGCRELVRAAKGGAAAGLPVLLVVPADNRPVRRVLDFMHFGDLLPVHTEAPPA